MYPVLQANMQDIPGLPGEQVPMRYPLEGADNTGQMTGLHTGLVICAGTVSPVPNLDLSHLKTGLPTSSNPKSQLIVHSLPIRKSLQSSVPAPFSGMRTGLHLDTGSSTHWNMVGSMLLSAKGKKVGILQVALLVQTTSMEGLERGKLE